MQHFNNCGVKQTKLKFEGENFSKFCQIGLYPPPERISACLFFLNIIMNASHYEKVTYFVTHLLEYELTPPHW